MLPYEKRSHRGDTTRARHPGKSARRRSRRQDRLAIEQLEDRVVMDSTQAFPVPLDLVLPAGSLIYNKSQPGRIEPAAETDTYLIDLDLAQTVTAVLQPNDGSLRGQLRLVGPGATELG